MLACVSYTETVFALATSDFVNCGGDIIPNTPISWFLGEYFEYNIQTLAVLVVISVAIETCIYNKLACLYLGVNLLEKSYFDFEMETWVISVICTLNVIVSCFLVYKGLKLVTRK